MSTNGDSIGSRKSSDIKDNESTHSRVLSTPLMLTWREFSVDPSRGEFLVNGKAIWVKEVYNNSQGTGLIVWDGAIVLSRFFEHSINLAGKSVIELGCGTALVSLTCATLGAACVMATDLNYVMENVRHNIQINNLSNIDSFELDWAANNSVVTDRLFNAVDYIGKCCL